MTRVVQKKRFTLAEVLAALVLAGIVLPVAVSGILLANRVAHAARHTETATRLASVVLAEKILTGDWESDEASGDFDEDWPGYRWELSASEWTEDEDLSTAMTQVKVTVYFVVQGQELSTSVSSLVVQVVEEP